MMRFGFEILMGFFLPHFSLIKIMYAFSSFTVKILNLWDTSRKCQMVTVNAGRLVTGQMIQIRWYWSYSHCCITRVRWVSIGSLRWMLPHYFLLTHWLITQFLSNFFFFSALILSFPHSPWSSSGSVLSELYMRLFLVLL